MIATSGESPSRLKTGPLPANGGTHTYSAQSSAPAAR